MLLRSVLRASVSMDRREKEVRELEENLSKTKCVAEKSEIASSLLTGTSDDAIADGVADGPEEINVGDAVGAAVRGIG